MAGHESVECMYKKSRRCKGKLFPGVDSDIETEMHCCNACADLMYEREQERREWDYYHPPGDKEP